MSFLQQVRANQISIHALREEGDTLRKRVLRPRQRFLSTPSARRATMCLANIDKRMKISIHALREEGDLVLPAHPNVLVLFLSTPSARRATWELLFNLSAKQFLSTPSARRATASYSASRAALLISIHALREEGDPRSIMRLHVRYNFYPRPPRGGRPASAAATVASLEFLSTPSARRATAKTETKSLFSNKLYNILHEFRRALIYNGSKNYPNHAK